MSGLSYFCYEHCPLDIHRPSASRHTAVVLAQELPISHSVKLSRASVINPLSEPLLASNASRHEDDMGSNYVEHYPLRIRTRSWMNPMYVWTILFLLRTLPS